MKKNIIYYSHVKMETSERSLPLVPFPAASPIMIAGPTGSGKTYWIHKLLQNNMFTEIPSSILYCYGVYQDFFDQFNIPNLEFHEGLPSFEKVKSLNDGNFNIIVLDDLMELIVDSVEIQNLFTKFCHHYNITCIFITQNIFAKGNCARNINLNTHIIVLFSNNRDKSQIYNIGKQILPYQNKAFMEIYLDATTNAYDYLAIDCDPKSHKDLQFRTKIFPGEYTICYKIKE
jgi:Cdc6-like AAA superfamily ATPase